MSHPNLSVYLNDHLAGSVAALEMLEHLEKAHPDTELALFTKRLRTEIEEDLQELETLMKRLDIVRSSAREVMAWLAEKATEVKLAMDDQAGGQLRLLEVMEAVSLGIEGKLSLWKSLEAVAEVSLDLRGPNYPELKRRAQKQRAQVEPIRLEAALEAFTTPSEVASH